MRPIIEDDMPLFERFLITTRHLFSFASKVFPKTFERPQSLVPFPSAMLKEHNWIYRLIFPRFFGKIAIDGEILRTLREASYRYTLVYVTKGIGQLEYNYFNYLFLKEGIPLVAYTNGLGMRRWMKWKDLWISIKAQSYEIIERGEPIDPERMGGMPSLTLGGSAILLQVPPSCLTDELLFQGGPMSFFQKLAGMKSSGTKPIAIVPLDFLWTRRPQGPRKSIVDILFGEKESPGRLRKIVLFWRNYKKEAQAIAGNPIELEGLALPKLREMLAQALKAKRLSLIGPPLRPRSWFIHEVMNDEKLDREICTMAAARKKPADDLRMLALRYAKEIIADLDPTYIELLDRALTPSFKKLYDSVNISPEALGRAKELCSKGPCIFVPNHKSHMDYLILAHALHHAGISLPYIAAGINLEFWPLGNLFRKSGAFFIRRAFRGNPLYRAVLVTYLKVLLREGYSQEFFIEGGRSRTGKLMRPRTGMLSMLGEAASDAGVTTLNFIPVTITYDRVIEQKSYEKELSGAGKEKESTRHIFGLTKYLRRQKSGYGSVYIRFGTTISKAITPFDVGLVAAEICHELNRGAVVTATSIAAAALLTPAQNGVSISDLKESYKIILDYLNYKGVMISEKLSSSGSRSFDEAMELLEQAKLIYARKNTLIPFYGIHEEKRVPLAFFKNGITHFLATISSVSRIIANGPREGQSLSEIAEYLEPAKQLLAHEFCFASSGTVESHVNSAVKFLAHEGAIEVLDGERVLISRDPLHARTCHLLAKQLSPFIETLWIALRFAMERMTEELEERQVINAMMDTGANLLPLCEIKYRESITKVGFENALRALTRIGVLHLKRLETGAKIRKIYYPSNDNQVAQKLKAELEKLL